MSGWRREALGAGAAAGLALVVAVLQLRPWRGDLAVPYDYTGDTNQTLMLTKGILDHGWFWRNPSVGAPDGQELFDYPLLNGDTFDVLALKVLGWVGLSASEAMNVFFLLTFPLVAVSAYLVLRELGLTLPTAVVCSALYALAPYHFLRGEGHLWLAAYYAVPLGAYLVLAVLEGRPLFSGRRAFFTLGLCAVLAVASGSFYYPAFTMLLAAVAAVVRFVLVRDVGELAAGAGVFLAIGAFCLVALSPSLVYWARHGTNPEVGRRAPAESELYSVRLTHLLLPTEEHRVRRLAELREKYYRWSPPSADIKPAALGAVAAAGFLWLLGVAVVSVVRPGGRFFSAVERHAAVLALVAFLVATTGGFSAFIGSVWPQLRAWNRLSIFISFFALLAVGLLVDRLRPRARVFGAVLAALFVVGVLDQTSPRLTPPQTALASEWGSDARFARAIEERLPAGAMVFQLPHVTFPEANAPAGMSDYDPVRGYLHSNDLRWSFGAMRGRPADRFESLVDAPARDAVPVAREAGFSGIWVDRNGYEDHGADAERQLRALLGPPAIVSENERFSFFPLGGA